MLARDSLRSSSPHMNHGKKCGKRNQAGTGHGTQTFDPKCLSAPLVCIPASGRRVAARIAALRVIHVLVDADVLLGTEVES